MYKRQDFKSDEVVGRNGETIGEICDKYFATTDICSTEARMRVLRFLENICLGSSAAVSYTHLDVYKRQSILDAGMLVGGGSDFSVTAMDPLRSAMICLQHPVESERISLYLSLIHISLLKK